MSDEHDLPGPDPMLGWAIAVIDADAEPDNIGIAAKKILIAYRAQRNREFICDRCYLRQDAPKAPGEPPF